MGGDHAPDVIVEGALLALRNSPAPLQVVLYGQASCLGRILPQDGGRDVLIVDAPEIIGMGDPPVAAVRTKRQSSIHVGLRDHRRGKTDAFLSAGNTGATVAASLFILGRLPGVARPTLPSYYPTTHGVCLLLDVGSNMDSKAEHLVQFGQMGAAYCRLLMGMDNPRVGLLSVGEEPGKGNELVKAANRLLARAHNVHFVGNVEGRDILHHGADVVVCDGFVGNVILKLGESIMTALPALARQEIGRLGMGDAVVAPIDRIFEGLAAKFNPEEYGGGAPLLGVDGTVFIMHGRSSARAVERCILMAARAAALNMSQSISAELMPHARN